MFAKNPIDSYYSGIRKLEAAEAQYRATLYELDGAIKDRRASAITHLRGVARDAEQATDIALQTATSAHREYWRKRLDALTPRVVEAAALIKQFNCIALAAGDNSHNPGFLKISNALDKLPGVDIVEEVPVESPDSELLGDYRGSWRSA